MNFGSCEPSAILLCIPLTHLQCLEQWIYHKSTHHCHANVMSLGFPILTVQANMDRVVTGYFLALSTVKEIIRFKAV